MTFDELRAVYEKWLDLTDDPGLLRIFYGAVTANFYKGLPVWLMLIAPPSTGKTELLMSLHKAKKIESVSSMTPYALLSGSKGDDNSLIYRLKDRILVVKDMSSTTEIGADDRSYLFSMLRDAYDGQCQRATGKGTISFKGKFGFIAAGTHSLEQGRKMESLLGERFLFLRPRINAEKVMDKAFGNAAKLEEMHEEMAVAAKEFLDNYTAPNGDKSLPLSVITTAREVAKTIVAGRTEIQRDGRDKEISFPAEVGEAPTRVYQQIILLMSAMKYLGAEKPELLQTLYRLALDCMPYVRLRVLRASVGQITTVAAVAASVRMSRTHIARIVEDLEMLGLVDRSNMMVEVTNPILQAALAAVPATASTTPVAP